METYQIPKVAHLLTDVRKRANMCMITEEIPTTYEEAYATALSITRYHKEELFPHPAVCDQRYKYFWTIESIEVRGSFFKSGYPRYWSIFDSDKWQCLGWNTIHNRVFVKRHDTYDMNKFRLTISEHIWIPPNPFPLNDLEEA